MGCESVTSLKVSQDIYTILLVLWTRFHTKRGISLLPTSGTLFFVEKRYRDERAIVSGEGVRICEKRDLVFTCSADGNGEVSQYRRTISLFRFELDCLRNIKRIPCGITAQIRPSLLRCDVSRSHTLGRTPLGRWSARRKRTLPTQHIIRTGEKHPCPQRDWIPLSQQ
jgi:hypothetical protein